MNSEYQIPPSRPSCITTFLKMISGFIPSDLTANQLLSLYNTFRKAGKVVRVFLGDISNAFAFPNILY